MADILFVTAGSSPNANEGRIVTELETAHAVTTVEDTTFTADIATHTSGQDVVLLAGNVGSDFTGLQGESIPVVALGNGTVGDLDLASGVGTAASSANWDVVDDTHPIPTELGVSNGSNQFLQAARTYNIVTTVPAAARVWAEELSSTNIAAFTVDAGDARLTSGAFAGPRAYLGYHDKMTEQTLGVQCIRVTCEWAAGLLESSTTTLTADAGSFDLTGTDASLEHNRLVPAEGGSFALTGADADLFYNSVVSGTPGVYSLTGGDADLLYNRLVSAESGSFALTGGDASLLFHRVLGAGAGTFTLTGSDATLTYSGSAEVFTLTAEGGSFALTGADASLLHNRLVSAESGAFTLTGAEVDLLLHRVLAADGGTFTLAGADVTLTVSGEIFPALRNALGPDTNVHRHLGPD